MIGSWGLSQDEMFIVSSASLCPNDKGTPGNEVGVRLVEIQLSIVFVSIEKIYQTLETVFNRLSHHFEFRQKYNAARTLFSVFG